MHALAGGGHLADLHDVVADRIARAVERARHHAHLVAALDVRQRVLEFATAKVLGGIGQFLDRARQLAGDPPHQPPPRHRAQQRRQRHPRGQPVQARQHIAFRGGQHKGPATAPHCRAMGQKALAIRRGVRKRDRLARRHRALQRQQVGPRLRHVTLQRVTQVQRRVGAEHQHAFGRQQHRPDADVARQLVDDVAQVLQRQVHADHAHRRGIHRIARAAQRQVVAGVQRAAAIGGEIRLGPPRVPVALGAQIPRHRAVVVAQVLHRFFQHARAVAMHVPDKPGVARLLRARLYDQARRTDIRVAAERGQQQGAQIERLQPHRAAAGRQRAAAHLHRVEHRRQAACGLLGQAIHLGARRLHQLGACAQVEHRAQQRQQHHQHRGGGQQHAHAQAVPPVHPRSDGHAVGWRCGTRGDGALPWWRMAPIMAVLRPPATGSRPPHPQLP